MYSCMGVLSYSVAALHFRSPRAGNNVRVIDAHVPCTRAMKFPSTFVLALRESAFAQHCGTEKLTQHQRNFDVQSIVVDRAAASLDSPAHAIADGIEMQM